MPNPKRLLQLFAVLVVVLMLVILGTPIVLTLARGDSVEKMLSIGTANTSGKLLIAEGARPYSLPHDSTITSMVAGEAMHSLRKFSDRTNSVFQFRTDVDAVQPRWLDQDYPDSLFPSAMPREWKGPSSMHILQAVAGGTTPEQRAYLDGIAADPVWQVWDRIATAPAVDVVGGQFVIPFGETATWYAMPIPKFATTKEYAYVSVTRAAAHLAAQRPDSAERALRATIGFGFAMVDNGVSLIEQLIGVVIVNIGRDALTKLYTVTNDPRGVVLAAMADSLTALSKTESAPRPPLRALNFEQGMVVALAPCTNVRELVGGLNAAHRAELDSLRKAVVRYPSEEALFDLIERSAVIAGAEGLYREESQYPSLTRVLSQFSSIAGRLTGNPRFATCGDLLLIPS